jgi:hypothetical protein
MDLRAIRDRIAAQHPAGIRGYARPPGTVGAFPAYIVTDPADIDYRLTFGGRIRVTVAIRVLVARRSEQDNTAALDDLVSVLPGQLEAITPDGLWQPNGFNVTGLSGGYFQFTNGNDSEALGADLTATIDI